MHKQEAAELFGVLSDEDKVKISKFLYTKGELSFEQIVSIVDTDETGAKEKINDLLNHELIIKTGNGYLSNKSRVEELMAFILTPCGCCHK